MVKENANDLRQIADGTARHIRALKALKRPADTWDDLIIYILSSKLNSGTARQWRTSLKEREIPTLKQFMAFLHHRCEVLEAPVKPVGGTSTQGRINIKRQGTHAATVKSQCNYCKEDHLIYYCADFLKLTIPERISKARKLKLCLNCLRSTNHSAPTCKSGHCKFCSERHNSLLHLKAKETNNSQSSNTALEPSQVEAITNSVTTCTSTSCSRITLLSTAVVDVLDRYGCGQRCRTLLDNGSQANLISSSFVKRLQLPTQTTDIVVSGINGTISKSSHIVQLTFQSRATNYRTNIKCIVTDKITERLPSRSIDKSKLQVPSHIRLADPNFHVSDDVDLLLGVEVFWELVCPNQIKISPGHPILQQTKLGWILAGGFTTNSKNSHVNTLHLSITNEELSNQLSQFWRIEEPPHLSDPFTIEEMECEHHFTQNVTRNPEGRIVVKLPIKDNKVNSISDTRAIALRRFYKIERKLDFRPILKRDYAQFMHEYVQLGHMTPIETEEPANTELPVFYLPHHCVIKPDSSSTKLRVVFDGSCKGPTGISLNNALRVGPVIQQDLISILLRFRTLPFVITADIIKMYRQVLIDPSQTQLQRIFWRDNSSDPLQIFELKTVTYGTSSASYLATRALKYLADLYKNDYPLASQCMLRDFYVDDVLTGGTSIDECIRLRDELIQLLGKGGFHLAKWASNNCRILSGLHDTMESNLSLDKTLNCKILGTLWNPSTDSLRYNAQDTGNHKSLTKRELLSEIAKVFDPLGLIGPVIIIPKLLMQELWQQNLQWDEPVFPSILSKWSQFKSELVSLNTLSISRCVKFSNDTSHLQLHGFADASQRAYGACIYLRSYTSKGEFRTELLCSKARVAPLKATSLPRLELCAAMLLAQLVHKVRSSVELANVKLFLWSDSTITLNWIASASRKWSVFVANRVGEIQRLTEITDWHHIQSTLNPADVLSRGLNSKELITCDLWWSGPPFLKHRESKWPVTETTPKIQESDMPELKGATTLSSTISLLPISSLLNKFSNIDKICRIVAYCLRVIKFRLRGSYVSKSITHQEASAALMIICRAVQHSTFSQEIDCLRNNQPLKSSSHLLSLSPFLDDNNLIRVGGRLRNSELSYDAKHPILLPKHHILTELIIKNTHIRNLHAGLQGTMAATRQLFWPLGIRSITRKIIKQCVICFKCNPSNSVAKMGNLPAPRVKPSRPFTTCGIDYAGPLTIRDGKRRNARHMKSYVCIFVCFATKAIHIELVSDLTSDAFLAALRRFVSRRGKPSSIFSDNGTTFVGASRQLSEIYEFLRKQEVKDSIHNYAQDSKISWTFIPPNAPHFGGIWEAGVKSIKFHLYRIVGTVALTFEELQTTLCEIEAILNSRPLIPLSTDPNDLSFISPGHFLIGDTLNSLPCHSLENVNMNRLTRWQLTDQLRQHFWRRWSQDYLHQLQQRHKWPTSKGDQLKVGQLALIKQPGLAPLQWLRGRVEKIHPGEDGIARSATLRTNKGTLVRPLSRLAILPTEECSNILSKTL
ncbi:uncharacterized protein LOC118648578 [Monomorium pharaonis]|uniref:uncharacterized protein LOC118648578 n=1 Tax=Monomorium pharaonis TaxID=307658 RepID=UPI0017464FDE|nr:uncharacterized protein LOC118648578 [Monomorium pharaonis]